MAAIASDLGSLFHLTQTGQRGARGQGIREDGTATSLSAVQDGDGSDRVSEITNGRVSVKDTARIGTQNAPDVPETQATDGDDMSDKDALKTTDADQLEGDEVEISENESRASHEASNVGVPETEAGDITRARSAQKYSNVGVPDTEAGDITRARSAQKGSNVGVPETEAGDIGRDRSAQTYSNVGVPETEAGDITRARSTQKGSNVGVPETEAGDIGRDRSAQKYSNVVLSETDVEKRASGHDIAPDDLAVLLDQEHVHSSNTGLGLARAMSQDEEMGSVLDTASFDLEDMEVDRSCMSQLISEIAPLDGMEGLYSVGKADWRMEGLYSVDKADWRKSDDGVQQTESRGQNGDNGFENTRVSSADRMVINMTTHGLLS